MAHEPRSIRLDVGPSIYACTPGASLGQSKACLDDTALTPESGWRDLNTRPLGPKPSALSKLSYIPLVGLGSLDLPTSCPPDTRASICATARYPVTLLAVTST